MPKFVYKRTKNSNIYCLPCPKEAKQKLNRNNRDVTASYTNSFQGFPNFSLFFWTESAKTFSKKFSTWRIYKCIYIGFSIKDFPPHLIQWVEYGSQGVEPTNKPSAPVIPPSLLQECTYTYKNTRRSRLLLELYFLSRLGPLLSVVTQWHLILLHESPTLVVALDMCFFKEVMVKFSSILCWGLSIFKL